MQLQAQSRLGALLSALLPRPLASETDTGRAEGLEREKLASGQRWKSLSGQMQGKE